MQGEMRVRIFQFR